MAGKKAMRAMKMKKKAMKAKGKKGQEKKDSDYNAVGAYVGSGNLEFNKKVYCVPFGTSLYNTAEMGVVCHLIIQLRLARRRNRTCLAAGTLHLEFRRNVMSKAN